VKLNISTLRHAHIVMYSIGP